MNAFWIYALEVNIYFSVFAAALFLIFRNDTPYPVKRWLILSAIAVSVVFPFLKFAPLTPTTEFVVQLQPVVISGKAALTQTSPGFNLPSILAWIYFAGVIISLLKLATDFYRIREFIRSSKVIFTKAGKTLVHKNLSSPISFFNTIVWPKGITQQDREWMQAHEAVHISEKHSFDLFFMRLFQAFSWFNPLVYLLKKELVATHEFQADEVVVQTLGNPENYSKLLVSKALDTHPSLLSHSFFSNSKLLKRRIMMMYKSKPKSKFRFKYLSLIPILAAGLFINACTDDQVVEPDKSIEVEKIINSTVEEFERQANDYFENRTSPDEEFRPEIEGVEIYKVDNIEYYKIVETMPEFPGGDNELMSFLGANIKYPEACKEEGVEGTVFVSFIVSKEGKVQNVNVLQSPDDRLSESAINTINQMPDWTPGSHDGNPVNVSYNLPIRYQLN